MHHWIERREHITQMGKVRQKVTKDMVELLLVIHGEADDKMWSTGDVGCLPS